MAVAFAQSPRPAAPPAPAPAGLTEVEATARHARDGANEAVVRAVWSLPREIARRFVNPLVAILILSSIGAAALGELEDAAVILGIVLLSIVIELVKRRLFRHMR